MLIPASRRDNQNGDFPTISRRGHNQNGDFPTISRRGHNQNGDFPTITRDVLHMDTMAW
jgi:hypothetical protein